jgi:hypothetical protein
MRGDASATSVVALLPGRYGPELHPGMEMRVEFDGFPHVYHRLAISSVSSEVLGAAAARRILGRDAAEGLDLNEPVLVVAALLPSTVFRAQGRQYALHDGMQARVEVKTRSESIIAALLPGSHDLVRPKVSTP